MTVNLGEMKTVQNAKFDFIMINTILLHIYRVCQKKERHFKYICKVANN